MKMYKTKTTKSNKDFYLPIDDEGEIIAPIFSFLKHLSITGKSKNTLRTYCLHLLVFWQYLKDNNFDYIEFADKKSATNKGAYENLVDYRLYLLYPKLNDNVVPIGGIEPAREERTVNQMISSVINFYKFLAATDIVGPLPVVQQMAALQHMHGVLNQMFMTKKKATKNLLISNVHETELRYVSEDEFNRCWEACTSRRNRVIIGLMFYGGLRVSEVVGLNIEDLEDIAENVIHITYRDDLDNPDAAVKYDSVGDVVIPDKLRNEIIDYMSDDLRGIDTNYLIINFRGKNLGGAMRTDTIRDMITALGKKTGIQGLHPHAFRHGCAMRMLRAEIDMMKISNVLRHRHVETTAETYAKYDLSDKVKVQKELSEKLQQDFEPLGIDFEQLAMELWDEDDDREGDADE